MASQLHVKEEPVRRRRCGNCGKLGHSRSTCPYSKLSKIYVHDEIIGSSIDESIDESVDESMPPQKTSRTYE